MTVYKESANNYTVKPGDTLWSIAARFNMPVGRLVQMNNIRRPYEVYPHQVLVINPVPSAENSQPQNGKAFTKAKNAQVSTYWTNSWTDIAGVRSTGALYSEPSILQRPTIETLGYIDPTATPDTAALIDELGQYLTYLGLFEFPVTETGDITGTPAPEILEAAARNQAAVLPVITNIRDGMFDPDLMRADLTNPDALQNMIEGILSMLRQYNMPGVILDLENLYPEDRDLFTNFIRILSERLHQENKILVLNLAAKWEEWEDKEWVGFFDYNALGPLIDIAAIMTYEWGYRDGPPQPTAPLPFVRRTLDYAIANNIPADKILMGMTLYGYDWTLPDTPENLAATVTLPQVMELVQTYNAQIMYDEEVQQPFVNYTDESGTAHQIWFENAQSHFAKYQLIQEYGLRGVFYWILHMPFPATWDMVSNLFDIRKL